MKSLSIRITELLKTEPALTSNQITEKLGAKATSVKVILCQMAKANKVVREKQAREGESKAGPQNLYTYRIPV